MAAQASSYRSRNIVSEQEAAMAATSVTPSPSPNAVRRVIAGHPVTATLLLMFGVSWGVLIPSALAGVPLEGPPLIAVVLFGQLLPAVLVTAAVGGRKAVRQLFSRVFRWRVHPGWYLVALLGIPVACLLGTAAVFGPGALRALVTDPSVIVAYLIALSILPVVNLWEETAWMGVVQARLADYRGPLLAAVMTGPLFALVHLPLRLGQPAGALILGMLTAMLLAIPFRIVIGWLYNRTGASILLVAIFHATFNATNNTQLLTAAAPGNAWVKEAPWAVIAVGGVLVAVLTRGRLGRPSQQPARAHQPTIQGEAVATDAVGVQPSRPVPSA
jgi:membrane protease YdiL (CAAX protease family)